MRSAGGAGSLTLARLTGGAFRVATSQTMTAIAAARKIEREMTSVPHLLSLLLSKATSRST
jgi:hypothetical protein